MKILLRKNRRIYRHEACWIFRLLKFGRINIELVYAPKGYEIREHNHPSQRIELMFLWGHATFYRREPTGEVIYKEVKSPWNTFKIFTIMPFHNHWFEVSTKPLLFLNFERWQDGIRITSAAEDLNYAKH